MPARLAAAPVVASLGAVVAWTGLIIQFVLSIRLAASRGVAFAESVAVYFGYFTILTNLLVAVALTTAVVAPGTALRRFFARSEVATALATGIAVVGLGYLILLRDAWDPEGYALVADVALHYATPALFLAYWWLSVPKGALRWRAVPIAAIYPLAYLVYVLLRGALTGFYPYPFMDVTQIGYAQMLANMLGMAAGYLAVATALVGLGRARARRFRPLTRRLA